MMHGDDKGLMLPPMIAPYQVVIVPIFNAASEELVVQKAIEIQRELQQAGIRVYFDNGKVNSPGEKYNEWEMKVNTQSQYQCQWFAYVI